jgi:hypothetical protein
MLAQHDYYATALEAYRPQRFLRTAKVQLMFRAIGEHIYHPSGGHAGCAMRSRGAKTSEERCGDLAGLYGGTLLGN